METETDLKKLNQMYIPNDEKTEDALGNVKKEIRNERIWRVFDKDIIENFHDRMVIEDPGEWIPATQEDSQNFAGYQSSGFNQLYQDIKTIYIQPLDLTMDEEFLENGKKYGEAFYFGLPVVIKKPKNIKKLGIKYRNREEGFTQYDAREILRKAEKWIPKDAYGMICITKYDLYPKDDWNFVFGLASLRNKTGVFSFARYDPSFFGEYHGMSEEEVKELVQFRSIKVMTHEIGHMFGIHHGVYYQGAMNGSMSAEEAEKRPAYLCPICLRKLWYNIGFDPLERFQAMVGVSDINQHFEKTNKWYCAMVEHLEEVYSSKKLTKPYKKRYPIKDIASHRAKSYKAFAIPGRVPASKSKKTGIERLKEERKKKG